MNLKFTQYDIERINRDESKEEDRLFALLSAWVARNPNGTVDDVRKAMSEAIRDYNLSRNDSRNDKKIYISSWSIILIFLVLSTCIFGFYAVFSVDVKLFFHIQTLQSLEPSPVIQHAEPCVLMIGQEIMESMDATNDKFSLLFSEMQIQLNILVSRNPKTRELLHRFICNKFNIPYSNNLIDNQLDHIDHLFKRVRKSYNYMDTSLLSSLDEQFLGGSFKTNIFTYRDSMIKFLNSTPISELTNRVWDVHRQFDNNTEVVLRLGRHWNDKNLENLKNLIDYVFGDDAALLVLISIHHSILTIIYTMPVELVTSVTLKATQPENTHRLKIAGVHALEVNLINVTLNFTNTAEPEPMDLSLILFEMIMNTTTNTTDSMVDDIQFIIDIGANVNYNNSYNSTPLHIASYYGVYRSCQILLKFLSEINAIDACGLSPLMVASIKDHPAVVDLLLEHGADMSHTHKMTGYNSLHMCTVLGHNECVVKHIQRIASINSQTSDGISSLHIAAFNGHKELVKVLVHGGANVNIQATTMLSLMDNAFLDESAIHSIFVGIKSLMVTRDVDIVELLLVHGANPITMYSKLNALNLAAYNGYKDIVEVLLEHGTSNTSMGISPLSTAAMSTHQHSYEIMNTLLQYEDINNRDPYYDDATPLMMAIIHGNLKMVQLLLDLDCDLKTKNRYDETAIDIAGEVLSQQFGFDSLGLYKARQSLNIWKRIVEKQVEISQMVANRLHVINDSSVSEADIIANKTLHPTEDYDQTSIKQVQVSPISITSSIVRARRNVISSASLYSDNDLYSVYELVYTVKYLMPKCKTNNASKSMVSFHTRFNQEYELNAFNVELTKLMPRVNTSISCYDNIIQ